MHLLDCALYTTQHPVSISLPNKVESGIKIHNMVVVQSFIRGQLFAASWTAALQASLSFTISWSLLKLMSIESVMPSNHLVVLSSPSLPTFNLHQGLFQWVSSSHQVAKVLELEFQHQSFQWMFRVDFLYDWLVWSPCCPRDSQEFSPAPHFKSINSLALSLLYSPAVTFIHDYWNHSFESMHLFHL